MQNKVEEGHFWISKQIDRVFPPQYSEETPQFIGSYTGKKDWTN